MLHLANHLKVNAMFPNVPEDFDKAILVQEEKIKGLEEQIKEM